ncbi:MULTISPECIES: hypothetical protein [Empedobacter]|uniref:hypothetical protein n=1 Tax=Empedobacter TaxID=59734 RepID=UPI001C590C8F|nr:MULTISPECIES: hypothetical protein [Empedobacter]MBW1618118.1 hypothetical protein [Empedobacter falsenii]MBY0066694.1 hypothetical protein [Empedobacter falsenii]MDH0659230.1 hypothetical protein [Empedobacter sp. GD03865]MDH1602082.1 hypothetical protein [Empedobacter sp. GD03739]MDM1138665.1 hypothetical protein [Empedobacter sp. R132-2]
MDPDFLILYTKVILVLHFVFDILLLIISIVAHGKKISFSNYLIFITISILLLSIIRLSIKEYLGVSIYELNIVTNILEKLLYIAFGIILIIGISKLKINKEEE